MRELQEAERQEMADAFGDELLVNGMAYKRHAPRTDTYHSLCGGLAVTRASYRRIGVHNGPIVIALELAAGLVERATPAMAYNIAHGYAQRDMRVHEESLAAHRLPPSRRTRLPVGRGPNAGPAGLPSGRSPDEVNTRDDSHLRSRRRLVGGEYYLQELARIREGGCHKRRRGGHAGNQSRLGDCSRLDENLRGILRRVAGVTHVARELLKAHEWKRRVLVQAHDKPTADPKVRGDVLQKREVESIGTSGRGTVNC